MKRDPVVQSDTKPRKRVEVVLLDIEGTTTPISFVKETLFPFVKEHLAEHLKSQWNTTQLKDDIQALRIQAQDDIIKGLSAPSIPDPEQEENFQKISETIQQYVNDQIDADRKTSALKQLQGHIWESGYVTKNLKGPIYDDVIAAFTKWQALEIPIYIYSSGSIHAQKLLFKYSVHGDLCPYIVDYFDTTSGSKLETTSYEKIGRVILEYLKISKKSKNIKTENKEENPKLETKRDVTEEVVDLSTILFVTDNINEAIASERARMLVALSLRPGNAELPENQFVKICSFNELFQLFEFENKLCFYSEKNSSKL